MINLTPELCNEQAVYVPSKEPCDECDLLREEFTEALEASQAAAAEAQESAESAEASANSAAASAQSASQDAEAARQYAQQASENAQTSTTKADSASASAQSANASANTAREYAEAAQEAVMGASDWGAVVIDIPAFSSLPLTVNDSRIESVQVLVESVLSNPSAQTGDWTVVTSTGSLTLSGSIDGTTSAKLTLIREKQ